VSVRIDKESQGIVQIAVMVLDLEPDDEDESDDAGTTQVPLFYVKEVQCTCVYYIGS